MGRFFANVYWHLRRWWGLSRASDAHRLAQRLDALRGRVASLEAEQRRMWEQGWRVPPARVVPLRSVPMDDN